VTIDQARELGRAFVDFCDGMEAAGVPEFARRGRVVADALERALAELEAERSGRVAAQETAQRWEAIARKWELAAREAEILANEPGPAL
jgi:hypothetical protein